MDMKSRIDLAKQILERNSSTAKETLDIMGFRIVDNELKLIDKNPMVIYSPNLKCKIKLLF